MSRFEEEVLDLLERLTDSVGELASECMGGGNWDSPAIDNPASDVYGEIKLLREGLSKRNRLSRRQLIRNRRR